MQTFFDPVETGGWVHDMAGGKQVLVHGEHLQRAISHRTAGIGDARVAVVAAELLSRSLNASLITPETQKVPGIQSREAPFTGETPRCRLTIPGNAFVEWDYVDTIQPQSIIEPIPAETDTHECVRR